MLQCDECQRISICFYSWWLSAFYYEVYKWLAQRWLMHDMKYSISSWYYFRLSFCMCTPIPVFLFRVLDYLLSMFLTLFFQSIWNTFSRYLHSRTRLSTKCDFVYVCISVPFLSLNRLTCSELSLIILSLISRETDDIDGDSADDDDDADDGMNATLTTTFACVCLCV